MPDQPKFEVKVIGYVYNDHWIDRLSSDVTVLILTVVAFIIVSVTNIFSQPIQCFTPAEMTDSMQKYVENFCYAQDTYFVAFDNPEPQLSQPIKKGQTAGAKWVNYYQWVPFILFMQAVCFYLPNLGWRILSKTTGVHLNIVLNMARHCQTSCKCDDPNVCFKVLAEHIRWLLMLHRSASIWDVSSRFAAVIFITKLLFIKALYVVNVIGQLCLLNALLGTNDPFFGINLVRNLANGTEWQQSGIFPRSVLCDFEVRDLGQNRGYTVQCVLVLNMFNEKFFIFLWYWMSFLAVISIGGLLWWIVTSVSPGYRRGFVRRLLPELPPEKNNEMFEAKYARFVSEYLTFDGVFMLRMIVDRTGAVVASKVTEYLWDDFLRDG